jgi:hypothetical protein
MCVHLRQISTANQTVIPDWLPWSRSVAVSGPSVLHRMGIGAFQHSSRFRAKRRVAALATRLQTDRDEPERRATHPGRAIQVLAH